MYRNDPLQNRAPLRWRLQGGASETFILLGALVLLWGTMGPKEANGEPSPVITALIDKGSIEFEYYDPREVEREFPGEASFRYETSAVYEYDIYYRRQGQQVIALIHVRINQLEIAPRHRVILPQSYEGADRWNDQLLLHELDHVAISSDARLLLLADHLIRNLPVLQVPLENAQRPAPQWCADQIDAAIEDRVESVSQIVRANYLVLDDITEHGLQPIPDRRAFFEALYTKPNLDHAAFTYTGQVLRLLTSPEYRNAELTYRWEE